MLNGVTPKILHQVLHVSLSLCLFSAVTDFNNGLEASSDSDDEDKLHIVEEDSLQEPEVANADGTKPQDSRDATTTVLPHNGSLNGGEMPSSKHEDCLLIRISV